MSAAQPRLGNRWNKPVKYMDWIPIRYCGQLQNIFQRKRRCNKNFTFKWRIALNEIELKILYLGKKTMEHAICDESLS